MMPRRPYHEIFLDKLRELGGSEKPVGNYNLQNQLGWSDDRYGRIHAQLASDGSIAVGRGKGGSVSLSAKSRARALDVFVSYSHVDEQFKQALIKHLEPLHKQGLIKTWYDQKIRPGDDWSSEISKSLENADIVLLLVSIDFINSAYCYDIELREALALHETGKARVIPILLRNCLWTALPFSKIQMLPKGAQAVASWTDRDDAYANIATEIKLIAEEIISTKAS
jgi:TIR domain